MRVAELERLWVCRKSNNQLNWEYTHRTQNNYIRIWKQFAFWLKENHIEEFNIDDIEKYKNITIKKLHSENKTYYCIVNFISSLSSLSRYLTEGTFRKNYKDNYIEFDKNKGKIFIDYLTNCEILEKSTYNQKRKNLFNFYIELIDKNIWLDDINIDFINNFVENISTNSNYSRYKIKSDLRIFLHWCYLSTITKIDKSIYVLKEKVVRDKNIPTSFTTDECKTILNSIEKSSKIGKRDYAIFLCIAIYGWRAGDVCNLKISNIDWRLNKISFYQQKTKAYIEYPLLSITGNAIYDYLINARPKSDNDNVFLLLSKRCYGKLMTIHTIYGLFNYYLRRANIKDISKRKHGPHALRFSLAIRLLNKGTSIDTAKIILGHKSINTTFNYLRIDIDSLKNCALKMPKCCSPFYNDKDV